MNINIHITVNDDGSVNVDCPEKEACTSYFGDNIDWVCKHCPNKDSKVNDFPPQLFIESLFSSFKPGHRFTESPKDGNAFAFITTGAPGASNLFREIKNHFQACLKGCATSAEIVLKGYPCHKNAPFLIIFN